MLGKSKFLNKWLEQPQYHAWLRNSPDIHKAHCTHESSRKPIKTTSLKPCDGITLMRIFDLSGKIPENTVL
jgi:hypothetical protein